MRLFIAVLIPPPILETLAQVQSHLRQAVPDRTLRWVAPENFHITLLFLGEQPESRLPAIRKAIQSASQQTAPFPVQVQGIGVFPNWNRSNVLWAGVQDPSQKLAYLAQVLERALAEHPSGKPFRAHITLARFKDPRADDLPKRLYDTVERLNNPYFGSFLVSHLSLMLSELRPEGSRYTELERFSLPNL